MRISDGSSDVCSSDLFLSANDADVNAALDAQFPAARVFSQSFVDATRHPNELRIAFDGDAVLFSDEAEQVFQSSGQIGRPSCRENCVSTCRSRWSPYH